MTTINHEVVVGAGLKPAPTLKSPRHYSNFPRILLLKNIEKAIKTRLDILSAARIKHVPNTPRSGKKITPVNIAPKNAPIWSALSVTPADTAISLLLCINSLLTSGNSKPVNTPAMPIKKSIQPLPQLNKKTVSGL